MEENKTKNIHVLFLFGGLPHYLTALLNKIHNSLEVSVSVLIPDKRSTVFGKGVHEDHCDAAFQIQYAQEYKTILGKPFFKDFAKIIWSIKPNIIVVGWPYFLGFLLHPFLLRKIKTSGIKLVLREIPFQVPKYDEVAQYYRNNKITDEAGEVIHSGGGFLQMVKYRLVAYLRKRFAAKASAIACYAECGKEIFPTYGASPANIFITNNTIDTDAAFAVYGQAEKLPAILPPNSFRVIHIGRLVKWKRVDLLLEAAASVKKNFPQTEVVIIGKGPEEENLKRLSADLLIEKDVHFVGAVYDPITIAQYFLSSGIYVLAGMGGLSINEAMAYGKPVICSVCDGTEKNLVFEMQNGLYFNEGSAEDLARKITVLFSDLEILSKMGKESKRIIREEINLTTVTNRYIKIFNFVTGKK